MDNLLLHYFKIWEINELRDKLLWTLYHTVLKTPIGGTASVSQVINQTTIIKSQFWEAEDRGD